MFHCQEVEVLTGLNVCEALESAFPPWVRIWSFYMHFVHTCIGKPKNYTHNILLRRLDYPMGVYI
jgi:hypothetical protein